MGREATAVEEPVAIATLVGPADTITTKDPIAEGSTKPAEPVEMAEPVQPAQPIEPIEFTEPIESVAPIEPVESFEPAKPIEDEWALPTPFKKMGKKGKGKKSAREDPVPETVEPVLEDREILAGREPVIEASPIETAETASPEDLIAITSTEPAESVEPAEDEWAIPTASKKKERKGRERSPCQRAQPQKLSNPFLKTAKLPLLKKQALWPQ